MRKALVHADVGVQEMADYLDVSRNAVSTWINGRIVPSTQTLRLWALRTGVPYEWLRTGNAPESSGDGPEGGNSVSGTGLPRLDSNQEPAGYTSAQVTPLRRAA